MSAVIIGILHEEQERNLNMQSQYRVEIEKLPKGSLYLKNIGKQAYYYLRYRDGSKIKLQYIGKDENKISELKIKLEKRKEYEAVLKRLKSEQNFISKIVKDKNNG